MYRSAHTKESQFCVIFRKTINIEQFNRRTCRPRLMISTRQTSLDFANTMSNYYWVAPIFM